MLDIILIILIVLIVHLNGCWMVILHVHLNGCWSGPSSKIGRSVLSTNVTHGYDPDVDGRIPVSIPETLAPVTGQKTMAYHSWLRHASIRSWIVALPESMTNSPFIPTMTAPHGGAKFIHDKDLKKINIKYKI